MYKVFSTFTGAGGIDIGFHGDFEFLKKKYPPLPFQTVYALEYNADAVKTIQQNPKYFGNTTALHQDITHNIDQELSKYKTGEFDVLIGGFPCVTFSIVGKQAGVKDDISGQLYESYAKYLEKLKPKVFLAENVKGILSANKGEAVKIIKKRFEIDGYDLKVFLVNFANFGVPQLRERVLFIGVRKDLGVEFIPPEYTNFKNHITCEQAFNNLPLGCPNMELMKVAKNTVARLKAIPEGGNYKDVEDSEHAVKGLMSNIYRKLDRTKPSYTVIASGGGGTWGYHYEEPRPLTNRERARLQGFPDDFIFYGGNTEARRQIGNAVPPAGIYYFAERIADVLSGKTPKYDPSKCIKPIEISSSDMTPKEVPDTAKKSKSKDEENSCDF